MKKLVSIMLVLALCLVAMPMWALADTDGSTTSGTHSHCVCGAAHADVGDHKTAATQEFTAWESDNALPTTAGYFYLTKDVTLTNVWYPKDGTVLCLNGHNIVMNADKPEVICVQDREVSLKAIAFTLTDCKSGDKQGKITHATGKIGGGVYVEDKCSFTMYGGVICDNNTIDKDGVLMRTPSGAGVLLDENATFKMYGGKISGNKNVDEDGKGYSGAGVYVRKAEFYLYGGEISGNLSALLAENTDGSKYICGDGGDGAGVYLSDGTFAMSGGTIKDNVSSNGAAVYVYSGEFTMSGGTIKDNIADDYGAVRISMTDEYNGDDDDDDDGERNTFIMSGGTISGNDILNDNAFGGGVYVGYNSVFKMTGGEISDNTTHRGGGVYASDYATITMSGGTIKNNKATGDDNYGYGGGVYLYEDVTFTMSGTAEISGNTADKCGGGVYVDEYATFKMLGGKICDNTAGASGGGVFYCSEPDDRGHLILGGNAQITDNKVGAVDSNIFLEDSKPIELDGTVPLVQGAAFGLGMDSRYRTVVVEDIGTNAAYFTADNGLMELVTDDDGDLVMQKKEYDIIVNGVLVTGTNNDVLGDGGSVKFQKVSDDDDEIGTLTLTNANITKDYCYDDNDWAAIYTELDTLNIVLVGKNTVTAPDHTAADYSDAIAAEDVNISGTGSLTLTGGTAKRKSTGMDADDVTIGDGVTLTATGGAASNKNHDAGSIGLDLGDLNIGKATVTAIAGNVNGEADPNSYYYEFYSTAIRAGEVNIAPGGNLTAKGGNVTGDSCASSHGIDTYSQVTVGAGATLTATAGTATVKNYGNAKSTGIYAEDLLEIGQNAKVTVTAGAATAKNLVTNDGVDTKEAYSCGIWLNEDYNSRNDDGKLAVADGATLTVTVGNATSEYYTYSVGIETDYAVEIGKANVTVKTGNATGVNYASAFGIMLNGTQDVTVKDGAQVTVTSGNATTNGAENYGFAYCKGIYGYRLNVGKANVQVSTGTALALNTAYDPDGGYCSEADNYGVYCVEMQVANGGKLIATAGNATCVDPADSTKAGKYVDAFSQGVYVQSNAQIEGTFVATAGNAHASCEQGSILYEGDTIDIPLGGAAASKGLEASGPVVVKAGANVKTVAGNAGLGGAAAEDSLQPVTSNGLWIAAGNLQMDGGALYVKSGTADGGDFSIIGIGIWHDDDEEDSGKLVMNAGWLKVETNDLAILAEKGIELGNGVTVRTPENGEVQSYTDSYTIVDKDDQYAATVLLWDGTTAAYTEPVSNSGSSGGGGGGSSKKDTTTTTPEDNKQENTNGGSNGSDFTDVKPGDYFYDSVKWATENKVTSGSTATTFAPNEVCTRAQIVTFLWRVAGCPVVDANITFTDVDENAYYAEAIRWAASKGIVDGYGDGIFAPNDTVTREQVAAILFRFAKAEGMDTTQGGMQIREFNDYESISEYAIAAMQWAVNAGIMQGYDNNLTPADECIRAQIVTMLYRLLGK